LQIADAFRVSRRFDDSGRLPGARFVLPWGALYGSEPINDAAQQVKQFARIGNGSAVAVSEGPRPLSSTEKPTKPDSGTTNRPVAESPGPSGAKPNMQKIISTMPTVDAAAAPQDVPVARAPETVVPAANQRDTLVVDPQHPGAIPTIAAACARAEDGAVIEIRHTGRMREGAIELGDRHLTVRAATGYRPIIEFAVNQFDLGGREPRLFDIRRGSLSLIGLDVHVIADSAISAQPWTTVASRGADVQIDGCTVTVHSVAGAISSVVRFLSSDMDDPMAASPSETPPTRPQLQVRNAFFVGMNHLVRIQPSVRVRMEIENCVLDVQENLLAVTGGMDRAIQAAVNEIEIRRATVRTRHGLVSYEANEARPWLPRLEITCTDNLFANEGDAPWIRFRSPRSADELRGLLRWKGMNNSYDSDAAFWEIGNTTLNGSEVQYWDDWMRSPARDEIKAERGSIEFAGPSADAAQWQRTRLHFKPISSAVADGMASDGGSRGADLSLIPPPPYERDTAAR
jgi:hypothetical protein